MRGIITYYPNIEVSRCIGIKGITYYKTKVRLDSGEVLKLSEFQEKYPHSGFEDREDGRYLVPDARKPEEREDD